MIIQKNVTIETNHYSNGNLQWRKYLVNGKTSRDPKDGPAWEWFHSNGKLGVQDYKVDGNYCRDVRDGPAHKVFHEDGTLSYEFYSPSGQVLTDTEVRAILNPALPPRPVPAPVILPEITITISGDRYRLAKE